MAGKFHLPKFDLADVVESLIERANNFDGDKASAHNLIDPFAAALESALNGYKSEAEWKNSEFQRTRQKNLMNHIGDLQQSIIGKLPGWISHKSGTNMPDVVGKRKKQLMICEVKNKHNTMNQNSSVGTYNVLAGFLQRPEFRGYTAAVVSIIAPIKNGVFFKSFSPSDRPNRLDIVSMPGRVFYAIATDPQGRVPFKSISPTEDLTKWPSWKAIDLMMEEFCNEIEKQTGYKTPDWIKKIYL